MSAPEAIVRAAIDAVYAGDEITALWRRAARITDDGQAARNEILRRAVDAAAGQVVTVERERIVRLIEAEGNRMVSAAMARMTTDQLDDDAMITQVMRGTTIGNLARRLPDLLKAADRRAS